MTTRTTSAALTRGIKAALAATAGQPVARIVVEVGGTRVEIERVDAAPPAPKDEADAWLERNLQ